MTRLLCFCLVLAATGTAEAAKKTSETPAAEEASAPFRYDSAGRRDPFSPLVRDGRLVAAGSGMRFEQSKPVLYGILWDPTGNSIALINDMEVRRGDRIGDYEVKEIQHDAVVLDNGGEEPVVLTIAFDAPSKPSPDTTTGGANP